jgi:hypothetical protein
MPSTINEEPKVTHAAGESLGSAQYYGNKKQAANYIKFLAKEYGVPLENIPMMEASFYQTIEEKIDYRLIELTPRIEYLFPNDNTILVKKALRVYLVTGSLKEAVKEVKAKGISRSHVYTWIDNLGLTLHPRKDKTH